MAYSVTKAAGLHLMKCLAFSQGPKVRINAILPGLLLTEWAGAISFVQDHIANMFQGSQYSIEAIQDLKNRSALKDVVSEDRIGAREYS
jgi:NAD(P)-dependent dehydrogenase (short-subunit alcohol dehydrogenase family)